MARRRLLLVGIAVASASSLAAPLATRVDRIGRVQIDVHYDCARAPPTQALLAAGLAIGASVHLSGNCTIEGWVDPRGLPAIAAAPGVTRIAAPRYAIPRRPPAAPGARLAQAAGRASVHAQAAAPSGIDGNALLIMRSDQFVSQTAVTGAGVTVGVQSTGVISLSTIQARGELPQVQIVGPGSAALYGDEGTALLEEVHAVAPGAGLAFCGPSTYVEYLACLGSLIGAGATILVDDVLFPATDLMSSDSSDAQSVEQLLTQHPNVTLFTAAGNANGSYWEGAYTPVSTASLGLPSLKCPTGGPTQTDAYVEAFDGTGVQHLTLTASDSYPLMLAWADPSGKNVSNFDLYWSSDTDGTQSGCFAVAASSSTLLSENLSLPYGSYTLRIATPDASLAGKYLKLWVGGDGLSMISTATPGSIVTPQAFAANVVTVGAVNGSDGSGLTIETFSTRGPLTVFFPTQQQLQAPTLVAPDGIMVDASGTLFESLLFPDGNFYGTSASAPNAGAVAALLLSAFPQLAGPQLLATLQAGAATLGSGVPNSTFGYGRVDALGALATLPTPTITPLSDAALAAGSSSPPETFTVTGTGPLHFTVTSSDPAVIPSAIVPAGGTGATLTPADCGRSTLTCTLAITPAYGGTADITLSALDGANRAASATLHVTVSGDPPPPASPPPAQPPSSSAGATSHGGGGIAGWWDIGLLALLIARRRRRAAARC